MMTFPLKQRLLLATLSLTAITLNGFASDNSPLTPNAVNSTTDPYFMNYAHASGNVDGNDEYDYSDLHDFSFRGIETLSISDNYDNILLLKDFGQTFHEVYADCTDSIFNTTAGSIIKIKGIPYDAPYAGAWTCSYLYIDFNKNKIFDVDQSIEDANNDLVVYNGYGLTYTRYYTPERGYYVDTDPYFSSTTLSGEKEEYKGDYHDTYSLPEFQLPSNMAPGRYRVRYKNDWNSTHPYGRTNETLYGYQCVDNGIMDIGGMIIDFTLRIKDNEEVMSIDEVGNDVMQEIDYSKPYDVYNMQGRRVGATTTGLVPGLYVVRQGAATAKIAIR